MKIMKTMMRMMMIVVTKAVGRGGGCLFLKGCSAPAHPAEQRKDWIFPFPVFLNFSTGLF